MGVFQEAITLFLTFENLILIVIGILVGQLLGAIPGMSSMMAISIAIPFTYTLSPVAAITLLMSFYKGALSGGSISATLIGTPGTASAAATVMDSHPLTLKGQGGKALQTAQVSSAMGSLFADILLLSVTGFMAQIALMMSSPELLIIVTFALLTVSTFTAGNRIRGILSAVMGISITMIGTDPSTGLARFSFGNPNLEVSLSVVPVLLGVLALSEIFHQTYLSKLKKQVHIFHLLNQKMIQE